MAQEDEFLIKARIDFDKANSIKQIKDITKYAEENLDKVLSRKKQSKNLKKINDEWHELVDYQNKFYDITYYKDRRKKPVSEEVSGSYITKHYGISKEKLTELRKAQKLELDSLSKSNTEAKKIQDEKLKNQESYNKKLDKIIAESKYYTTLKDYQKGSKNIGVLNTTYGKQGVDITQGENLFNKLNRQIEINKGVKNLALSQALLEIENYNKELDKRNKAELEWAKIVNSTLSPKEIEIMEKEQTLDSLKSRYKELSLLENTEDELREIEEQAKKTSEELNKLTNVSQFQKLVNTIKRVGFYRIARNLFRLIENGFKQGIQNLAKFDSGVNETMSKLTSNFTTIANSFTLMVMPLIKILQPAVELITRLVANIANSVSYFVAQLKGATEYTKINADYMKDFANSTNSALLSFDKFESLSNNDVPNMFYTESINKSPLEGFGEELSGIDVDTIYALLGTAVFFAGSKFVSWIMGGGLVSLFKDIAAVVPEIMPILAIFTTIYDLLQIIRDIQYVMKNYKTMGVEQWFYMIIINLLRVLSIVAAIKGLITGNWLLVAAAAGGSILANVAHTKMFGYTQYADGGLVDKGSLFVAGEAGAELVTTMPSGQTGVTNIAQFKQAMVEALDEWSVGNSENSGDIVLNLDGAEIARSRRFRTEMNLRNASLNLR